MFVCQNVPSFRRRGSPSFTANKQFPLLEFRYVLKDSELVKVPDQAAVVVLLVVSIWRHSVVCRNNELGTLPLLDYLATVR